MSNFNLILARKLGLSHGEILTLKKLKSPQKIQDYISAMPGNLEKNGETLMSPRLVLQENTCHCFEGALLGSLTLWLHGYEPLIVDMQSKKYDFDHVIAVFKQNGYWGAISKTNHAINRFRDPIYKSLRELMMTYFHEFYMSNSGEKTLLAYSEPFNLKMLKGRNWVTQIEPLWYLDQELNKVPHLPFVLNDKIKLRPADKFERIVTDRTEYK